MKPRGETLETKEETRKPKKKFQSARILVNCSGVPGGKERPSGIRKSLQARQKDRYRCCPQESYQGSVFLQGPGQGHGLDGAAAGGEIS